MRKRVYYTKQNPLPKRYGMNVFEYVIFKICSWLQGVFWAIGLILFNKGMAKHRAKIKPTTNPEPNGQYN